MLKKNILQATALFAITCSLNATDSSQMRNLEDRVTALEKNKGINPSARPEAKNGTGLFITGEALYWKATQNGLQFVIENTQLPNLASILDILPIVVGSNFVNADIESPKPRYDWGFRVGLGYNLPRDGWDIDLVWTHLFSKIRHKEPDRDNSCSPCEPCCSPEVAVLYPTWTNAASSIFGPLETAEAHWENQLNVLDLELGREFYVSQFLSLRPHVGLRGDIIHTRYKVEYSSEGVNIDIPLDTEYNVRMKNRFWGVGLRGGMDTDWILCYGVSLYGNAAISLLYGHFIVKRSDDFDRVILNVPAIFSGFGVFEDFSFKKRFWDEVATTDLQLGLRWDHTFCKERFHLGINVGWEHHLFFHMNQFIEANAFDFQSVVMTSDIGDLGYQGWTAGFRFDF